MTGLGICISGPSSPEQAMIPIKQNMRQGCMLLSVFCLIGIIACSGEEGHDIQIPNPVICTLNYTIPDTEIPDTRASDTGGKISVARPEESAIKDVKLLFFIYDEHGNGLYAGSLDGTVDGNHLAKTGKISVTIPGSGSIDNHTDYDVLAVSYTHLCRLLTAYRTDGISFMMLRPI